MVGIKLFNPKAESIMYIQFNFHFYGLCNVHYVATQLYGIVLISGILCRLCRSFRKSFHEIFRT